MATISKNAKRVFKGKIFDVYQWRQKMFDGTYHTFEYVKRPDTVIVIATHKNKIIVLKQKQPNTSWFYSSPAGRIDDPKEKPRAAALRELLEETGMKPKKMLFWKKIKRKGKIRQTYYFYIARDCEKVAKQKLDPGEKIKILFYPFEKFLKLADSPINRQWLGETTIDMFQARLNPKYKRRFKKLIFE